MRLPVRAGEVSAEASEKPVDGDPAAELSTVEAAAEVVAAAEPSASEMEGPEPVAVVVAAVEADAVEEEEPTAAAVSNEIAGAGMSTK